MNTLAINVLTADMLTPARSTAELDRLGDEIAELSAHLDAATARLLDLIREFDAREGWGNGFRSCAHWLSWRVGLDIGAAREKVRVARALGTLPRLAQALARGELSYAKVRALTRVATPATEERLLAVGRAGTAEHVERIVRGWRRVDRIAEARETAQRHKCRGLRVYLDHDGMVAVRGRLEPEVGELLIQALTAAREALYQRTRRTFDDPGPRDISNEPPALEQQQADALGLLAETALHHGIDPGAPGERYQVVVHVDAPTLADPDASGQSALENGEHVSAETSRRLACGASRVVMQHARDGRVVEVAARTRTIPPALRRALHHRDHGCRFPGCHVRFGGRRRSRTSPCSAVGIIAPFTRRVMRSSASLAASCASVVPMERCCPRCRRSRRYPMILPPFCERRIARRGWPCTRARRHRSGRANAWT
jgi:Domain of unknown function (DUF222)